MKSCILFIIIGFIQSVICCSGQTNITQDEADHVCPISFFRRKRAIEYTRWRATEETTPQFLVKVLDDDIPPPPSNKKIVAVNILPIVTETEKIIIGGAAVPSPTTPATTVDLFRDYTRFVPPTTVPAPHIVQQFVAPAHTLKRPPLKSKGRHSQRDESPPASPQFLPHTPALRQYAPIAAVAFTKHGPVSPLTPSTNNDDRRGFRMGNAIPTRTSPLPDISVPTRTEYASDYSPYRILDSSEEPNLIFMTRTTFVPPYPVRSTLDNSINDDESLIPLPKNIYNEDIRRHEFKKKTYKDVEASYNMMFYDEDSDVSTRKSEDTTDSYDEKNKIEESTASIIYDDLKEPRRNDLKEAAAMSGKAETEINDVSDTNSETEPSSIANDDNLDNKNKIATTGQLKEPPPIEPLKETKRRLCNLIKIRKLDFNMPHTLPEIIAQLRRWAEDSPVAKWVDITNGNYTTLENPIYMMIIEDPTSGQIVSAKQTVMIVAGIHGRDHHAVAAAMYILYQLIERTSAHTDLLSNYRFWIIPVFNPDGYDYSYTFPHRRNWSKNLRQNWETCTERLSCKTCETLGLRCTVQPCYGVNLDRNFEYQWIPTDELRSEHPCGPLYAGARQLSEPETRALTQFLHAQKMPLFTFICLKEGDVLGILYPYSHTKKRRAMDKLYRQRASAAAGAATSIVGRHYVFGQTSEYLPLYAGGIEDWIDGHLGVDNTYTIMMFRPPESYNSKLLTERVVHEAFAAMDTLLLQSLEPQNAVLAGNPMIPMKMRSKVVRHTSSTNVVIFVNFALRYLT